MLISTQKSTKKTIFQSKVFSIVYTFNPWQYLYWSLCILGILPTLLGGKQQPAKAYPEMHCRVYTAWLKGSAWSALDAIQNHLGREGLRWNDGQLMTCYTKWKLWSYDNMPTYPDDPSVLFVWEIASKLFTQEMVSINLLFDCSIIKHFTQFYADISRI